MRFNPKARLDTGRVKDAGNGGGGLGMPGGGGGGMRIPMPGGKAGGGGILGIIIAVIVFFVAGQGGGGGFQLPSPGSAGGGYDTQRFNDTGRYDGCQTGADANDSPDCTRVAVENSLTNYWADQFGSGFEPVSGITTFKGSVQTSCGNASASIGPFYCPADRGIYLDDAFFEEVLVGRLGGPRGQFVEPYVLAHEYGHHISNLLGNLGKVRGDAGPQSTSTRLELQADCFAGMWTRAATEVPDAQGEILISELTEEDIQVAQQAAWTVGDDYIQQRSGGRVDEGAFTHGSSEQRVKWFKIGFQQGTLEACDTFSARSV